MKQLFFGFTMFVFISCGVQNYTYSLQPVKPSNTLADTISVRRTFFNTFYISNGILLTDRDLQIKTSQMPEANRLIHQSQRNFSPA